MLTLIQVAVKIGDIKKTSRTSIPVDNDQFSLDDAARSFVAMCVMVEERVSAAFGAYRVKTVRPDKALHIKPSLGVVQKEWVVLTEDNWCVMLNTLSANYDKRKKKTGPLVIELFVLATKAMDDIDHALTKKLYISIDPQHRFLVFGLSSLGNIPPTHPITPSYRPPHGSTKKSISTRNTESFTLVSQ